MTGRPLQTVCAVLGIGRATAYRGTPGRPAFYTKADDATVHAQIRAVLHTRGSYGYRRVTVVLNRTFGTRYNRKRIQRVISRALAWIDSLPPGERFFLTYLPIAGHHPYETPEPGPFPERAESDRYLNALHYADASLGALLRGLRDRGLDRNALFVVFGDHGQAFGRHQGNYGHTLFLYEENIRVPYLIAAPGLITQQARIAGRFGVSATHVAMPISSRTQSLVGGIDQALFGTSSSLRFCAQVRGLFH